ncbi:MAG: SusC/RagA family TonB-linked outer membrane protein [Bacteroidota bacterium]
MKNNYSRLKWVALIILGGILFFLSKSANAAILTPEGFQQQEVSGIVTDQNGIPIPGVTVTIKNTSRGTFTDLNGAYNIAAPENAILIFSYVGYKSLEENINNRQEINIELEEDVAALGEVQINAGYYNTTERERTGSISRVTAEEIERQPVTNPLAALQGRMPGVNITQNTGVPGGGFDIEIRGRNSLRADGNDPLYIVDGVPFDSKSLADNQVSGLLLPGLGISPLNSISPNDIKSIEILKDADATAIYGSRGANGVVLITTKKGKAGKVKLNVGGSYGLAEITRPLDLMNTEQYLAMRREAFANDGVTEYPANAYDINGTWDQERYTDWQDVLIGGTAETTNSNISLSGGSENTRFLLGGNYHHETTVFPGDYSYERVSMNSNVNHTSRDERLNINFSSNFSVDKNNQIAADPTRNSRTISPNAPALYDDTGNLNWADGTWKNPLAALEEEYLGASKNLIANSELSYKVLSDLIFKVNFGFNYSQLEETRISPHTKYNPAYGLTSAYSSLFRNNSSRNSWITEPQLNYRKQFNKHSLDIILGSTFQKQVNKRLAVSGYDFSSNNLIKNLVAASRITLRADDKIEYAYQAIFGRLNYNYSGKYIVNLTARRDGSSRFGNNKKFSNFGAIGTAWVLSEEEFWSDMKPNLNLFKLRASYGLTGSDQIGDYQYLDTYSPIGNSYSNTTGLRPNRLYNPDFSWEENRKFEIGLEIGAFEDKLFLSTSFFRNISSNQLVGIPLPGTTGFSSVQSNLNATVLNKGLEVELRTINFKNSEFQWDTNFNLTLPKNELVSFPGLEGSTYENQYVVGEPLNIEKVYTFTGVEPTTGLYQFEDVNGDGIISAPGDYNSYIQTSPSVYGGLSNNISFKRFNFNFLFQFVKQDKRNFSASGAIPGTINNQYVGVLDRWQAPGDVKPIQRFSNSNSTVFAAYDDFQDSSGSVSDASFIRLKNVSFNYRLPIPKINANLFIRAQNLLTLTDYEGADPENGTSTRLPPLRNITLGFNASF